MRNLRLGREGGGGGGGWNGGNEANAKMAENDTEKERWSMANMRRFCKNGKWTSFHFERGS